MQTQHKGSTNPFLYCIFANEFKSNTKYKYHISHLCETPIFEAFMPMKKSLSPGEGFRERVKTPRKCGGEKFRKPPVSS